MRAILEYIDHRRETDDLSVETMSEVARRTNAQYSGQVGSHTDAVSLD